MSMTPIAGSFADEVRAFEAADLLSPPPHAPVLFYGSSSIRLWSTLAADFPEWPVLNRGFGGSTLEDCVYRYDRLAQPYEPKSIVFYAGDNDLDQGASPERVAQLFAELMQKIRATLGEVPVTFIAIKPSPARWWNLKNIEKSNQLVEQYASAQSRISFLNTFPSMLDGDGGPRRDLYQSDGLHLSDEGYRLWVGMLRQHNIF